MAHGFDLAGLDPWAIYICQIHYILLVIHRFMMAQIVLSPNVPL